MALKRGLIKCTGKTPEATMASALYTGKGGGLRVALAALAAARRWE